MTFKPWGEERAPHAEGSHNTCVSTRVEHGRTPVARVSAHRRTVAPRKGGSRTRRPPRARPPGRWAPLPACRPRQTAAACPWRHRLRGGRRRMRHATSPCFARRRPNVFRRRRRRGPLRRLRRLRRRWRGGGVTGAIGRACSSPGCQATDTPLVPQATRCLFSSAVLPNPGAALDRARDVFAFDFAGLKTVWRSRHVCFGR